MASKKKLTDKEMLERTEGAVTRIMDMLPIRETVAKYMRERGRIRQRQSIADFVKEYDADSDDVFDDEDLLRELHEDVNVMVDSILEEIAGHSKK